MNGSGDAPMSRLAIGTAQFGMRYGLANESGIVTAQALKAILDRAAGAGLNTLDTAISYGDSEHRLGEAGVSSWMVVSKLPAAPEGVIDIFHWSRAQVLGSLDRLRIQQLEAVLLHHPPDLLRGIGRDYIDALQALKSEGLIRAAGISIYDPSELDDIWPLWRPDIVQAPFNVLDRRLLQSGWLQKLIDHGVRVHTRSSFLQGLLLMSPQRRPAYFEHWQPLLDRWAAFCIANQQSQLEAALRFAQSQPGIERVIVGVDSLSHLEQLLSKSALNAAIPPADLFSDDRDLVEPRRWRII
jgi:aryl-alcohol dehydrogenase-like predicted oxidoreductase